MTHQNEHLRNVIHAELAVPVADSWIYRTMPFLHLPQAGDQIWLKNELAFVVDRVEHIFHRIEPPYITICCRRITIKERDTHINFLNNFGFDTVSAYAKHVE